MLNQPTVEKLHALRLGTMAEAWQTQQRDTAAGALSFDERFAMIVDAEYLARDNRRLARLLKDAELRIPGDCMEDVDGSASRGVDRAMLRQLATCVSVSVFFEGVRIAFPAGRGASQKGSVEADSRQNGGLRCWMALVGAMLGGGCAARARRNHHPSPRKTRWLKSRKQGFRSALRELDKNRVPFRHEAVRHTFRLCRSQDGLDALRPASAVTRFGRNPLHLHGAAQRARLRRMPALPSG